MSANTDGPLSLESFPVPIVHMDCDAFFTSVEQALHPELKGRPVVTGKERGIVACASYEAKALGVKRPMRLFEAKKICPQLVSLPSDYETYSLFSKRMFDILRRFTPSVEEYSIDEAFAELSGLRRLFRCGYEEIARKMKQTVQAELGITVSVGLSASKTLAKIAAKMEKPDGFVTLRVRDLHRVLKTLPLECVCGFGPNTVAYLEKHGMKKAWDFAAKEVRWARQHLGKIGEELWHELRGEAVYPVSSAEKTNYASISKTKTFTPPSSDRNYVFAQLVKNMESAFIKLRRYQLRACALAVYLRKQDFRSLGAEGRLTRATSSAQEALPLVRELFDSVYEPETLYRLTGVVLASLETDTVMQYDLFEDPVRLQKMQAISQTIDEAAAMYGKHTLRLGTGLWLKGQPQHVAQRGDLPSRKKIRLPGETFRSRLGIPLLNLPVS